MQKLHVEPDLPNISYTKKLTPNSSPVVGCDQIKFVAKKKEKYTKAILKN